MAKVGGKAKSNKKDNSGFRIIAWTIATIIIVITVNLKDYFLTDSCGAPLRYQAENLSFELAVDKLKLNVGSNTQSVRVVSEVVQGLIVQSRQLCEMLEQGRIESSIYVDRQDRLSQQFERLAVLQLAAPAGNVSVEQLPSYSETVKHIKVQDPVADAVSDFSYQVFVHGHPVASGVRLTQGDQFHVEVELSQPSYFYLVLKDSSGVMHRLYPESENQQPVSGRLRFPQDIGKHYQLDGVSGEEKILFFAGQTPSKAIFNELDSLALLEASLKRRGIFVVDSHEGNKFAVSSSIGQPVAAFVIEHY